MIQAGQIFQVEGYVTGVKDGSTDNYEMVGITLDGHFHATCFGRPAKAILAQQWLDERVRLTVQTSLSKDEKYTNYNLVHMSSIGLPKSKK